MSLVGDDKKANVIAAKAMAYAARKEFTRAHEIVTQSRYGPTSRANEFSTDKALIERNLSDPILLRYAARMIELGWETRDPLNPIASQLLERATDIGVEIPNIVQMWEEKALITFFDRAQEFILAALT
jgi:hypothetical protein